MVWWRRRVLLVGLPVHSLPVHRHVHKCMLMQDAAAASKQIPAQTMKMTRPVVTRTTHPLQSRGGMSHTSGMISPYTTSCGGPSSKRKVSGNGTMALRFVLLLKTRQALLMTLSLMADDTPGAPHSLLLLLQRVSYFLSSAWKCGEQLLRARIQIRAMVAVMVRLLFVSLRLLRRRPITATAMPQDLVGSKRIFSADYILQQTTEKCDRSVSMRKVLQAVLAISCIARQTVLMVWCQPYAVFCVHQEDGSPCLCLIT